MPPGTGGEDGHVHAVGGSLGNWGVAVAVFKGNIGSVVLFMPHTLAIGGYAYGLATIVVVASLTIFCTSILVSCRARNDLSYGDLMMVATGRAGRGVANACVVLLQTSICCLYLINVASFLSKDALPHINVNALIFCSAAIVVPMVLIRNVAKLGFVNLAASVLFVMALIAVLVAFCLQVDADGPAKLVPFRPAGALVALGTICYSMEGIGLVLPIYDSSRNPDQFLVVYSMTILFVASLLCGTGALGYLAFGPVPQTLVLLDLPMGLLVKAVDIAFGVQMLGTFPLQLLPAIRIVESLLLAPSRPMTWDKYKKNAFRVAFVALVAGIAVAGATSLDHFVGLVGAFCGVPLAFVFPALIHIRLKAVPWTFAFYADLGLIVIGVACTVVVAAVCIITWGD